MQKGDRIGAILSRNEDGSINLLGYGVYAGDCIPAEAVGFMADGLKAAGAVNPCMKLDNGDVVYACECWWGRRDPWFRDCLTDTVDDIKKILPDINDIDTPISSANGGRKHRRREDRWLRNL